MRLNITPPPGYTAVSRQLWALADCTHCDGAGDVIVCDDSDPELRYPQPCECLWSPDDAPSRIALAWIGVFQEIGPRQVGGRYWNGYWKHSYTVTDIAITVGAQPESISWRITVQHDDGRLITHCTAWDSYRGDALTPPSRRQSTPAESESSSQPSCDVAARWTPRWSIPRRRRPRP